MNALEDKQILIVVGQKNYNTEEFNQLFETLEAEGADVCVASNTMEKALGRLEGFVSPDISIAEVHEEDFDALVIIGGYGARLYLWDSQDLQELVRRFVKAKKIVAAASTAPVVLANAGVLDGRRATVYPDYESTLAIESSGGKYIHENVVTDDNIITSSHPRFITDLTGAIVGALKGSD